MRPSAPFRVLAGTVFVVALILAVLASRASAQTDVTTCGQEVTGAASLPADLDCTGVSGNAVTIHGGTLAMNGHSITGGDTGIACDHPCRVNGPGLVTGSKFFGVNAIETSIHMQQVDLTNDGVMGIQSFKTCVLVGPSTISGNGIGIRLGTTGKLTDVTITGNQDAIFAANDRGGGAVAMTNGSVTGNDRGISAYLRVKLTNTTVTGNGTFGVSVGPPQCVRGGHVLLKGSTVTGNDTDASCGSTSVCADVETCGGVPTLKLGSTCDHSYLIGSGNPGTTLHVCSLD